MKTGTKWLARNHWNNVSLLLAVMALTFILVLTAPAQTLAPLYEFQGGSTGDYPYAGVVIDQAGNLYGTTLYGGVNNCRAGLGCGVVYEISPPSSGSGPWTETILHTFTNGSDGATPYAGLVSDGAGNLYGTAYSGGNFKSSNCTYQGCGVVFELSPAGNGTWTETVLYTFNGGYDGSSPFGTLIRDAAGNLYGTTVGGGAVHATNCTGGCGVVFELSPGTSGWTETVLYRFAGEHDGAEPFSGVTFDSVGNLYGTTTQSGALDCGCGTVFELSPVSGGWKETTLHIFTQLNGNTPQGPVLFDAAGNLYGTTVDGGPPQGCDNGCGLVFELSQSNSWAETKLHDFSQNGPFWPSGSLVFDSAGNLYGTVQGGGPGGGGIYRMAQQAGVWKLTGFFAGNNSLGNTPIGGLISDSSGNLYGSAATGGKGNSGAVFKFVP